MQLPKKLQIFSEFFTGFLKSTFNFQHFGKNYEPHSICIFQIIAKEKRGYVTVYGVPFQNNLG